MIHPGARGKDTEETAVYRLFDAEGRLLYVGMGRNPMQRWGSHAEQHPWWPRVVRFTVKWHPTRQEAAAEERQALRSESPVNNIHGTERHGLVTGAGVRRELELRRAAQRRRAEQAAAASDPE
ncbi:GIY-YIG nuclease family protein [Streptomyces triculaminicus]|uniref:GIY-YIG nuclease family protein n=1 Tax=Streptomyces triculaminicus TaxID=2816232 RepID=UPI0037AD0C0A